MENVELKETTLEEAKVEDTEKKPYNPLDYPRATLREFGYRDYTWLKRVWKVVEILLIIFTIFMLYISIIIIAIQSFNSSNSISSFASFTFDNYIHMFDNDELNSALLSTFEVAIVATLVATVLGTLIGIGIYYLPPKVKSRLILLNNIPLLNADIVTGVSIALIFAVLKFFNKFIFGFWTMLFAHVYFILPYVILNVLPKMKEIDPNMLDASLDLGLKPMKSVRKVLIPAIKGGIFSGMVLAFTISFEDFVVGLFTSGNGFSTLSIWLYSVIGKKDLFPGVYAFSTMLTILMIVAIVIYNFAKGKIENVRKKKNN